MRTEQPRVLVVTNMWPRAAAPYSGVFVKEQVEAVRDHEGLSVDVHFIHGKQGYLRALTQVPKIAKTGGYDIVHAHYGLTGAAAALVRVPLVVTYHGSDVNLRWQRGISWFAAQRADRRIVVSAGMERLLRTRNTQVIPCGVNTDVFRFQEREEGRRELALAENDLAVLFPSHPGNPAKDFALFSEAVAALDPAVRPAVKVFTLQAVERSRVPRLLSAVDVLVMTSKREGSPMVVKEALACGLPVVSVPVGDVSTVVDGVSGCHVVARDAGLLAKAVESVLAERRRVDGVRRLRELGLDGRTTARRVAGVYRDLYAEKDRRTE